MVDEVEQHIGQVKPESDRKGWMKVYQVEGDLVTHIICHSFGGKCLNLKKTKLFTPLAMLGFSSGGFSRSSCTEGVDVSKT